MRLLETRHLPFKEDWLHRRLKHLCLGLASLERTVARLRSRVLYLKEGNANTSFFHQQARIWKRKNFIAKLQVDDHIVTNQEEKHSAIFDFYSNLLGDAEQRSTTLYLQAFHLHHDLSPLDALFTEEEVWETIKELPEDKAQCPDGFTGHFYKSCWHIIKSDVMRALLAVQQGCFFKFQLLNTTFLTLLPKKPDVVQVKNYRPISLIHSFAKLLAKILATRLDIGAFVKRQYRRRQQAASAQQILRQKENKIDRDRVC